MSKGFIIIDGSNIGFQATAGARKKGAKLLKVGEQETGGAFYFLRSIQAICQRLPILTPIVCWDNVSWRKKELAAYKASRDDAPTTKSQELLAEHRAAFKSQRPLMCEGLELLGVAQIQALNLEADDIGGMLVRRYHDKTLLLLTSDKDWVQLVSPKVTWFDPLNNRRIRPSTIKAELGVENAQQWLEVKALAGDSSDEISGVGGIGVKGAIELVTTYGSVGEFLNRSIDGTLPKLPKKFADLAESAEKQAIYRRNIRLMDLRTPNIAPPPVNLTVNKGQFDKAGFDDFAKRWLFQSILNDNEWCDPFAPKEAA